MALANGVRNEPEKQITKTTTRVVETPQGKAAWTAGVAGRNKPTEGVEISGGNW
jgi:hypothetical protein